MRFLCCDITVTLNLAISQEVVSVKRKGLGHGPCGICNDIFFVQLVIKRKHEKPLDHLQMIKQTFI